MRVNIVRVKRGRARTQGRAQRHRKGNRTTETIYSPLLMRELLYNAAKHYKKGKAMADRGDVRAAMAAFEAALSDLHAVKPQRMRDVLLAQVYLSRYQCSNRSDPRRAAGDLRRGYSYARTTMEPSVRQLADELWEEHLATRRTATSG